MTVLRIGVTGHRWTKLDTDLAELYANQLSRGLAALAGEAEAVTLVSGLAEGTDTLAAIFRPAGWGLEAALALPRAEWRAHLLRTPVTGHSDAALYDHAMTDANKVLEFAAPCEAPAYSAVGEHLVATCDCILALWDGHPGLPGGTGDVVGRARAQGLDVLHLFPAMREETRTELIRRLRETLPASGLEPRHGLALIRSEANDKTDTAGDIDILFLGFGSGDQPLASRIIARFDAAAPGRIVAIEPDRITNDMRRSLLADARHFWP